MSIDQAFNFAIARVSQGYDAAATSIVLNSGGGARFGATPFYATWWNATDYDDPSDDPSREIVRVTGISTETLTITRGQQTNQGGLAASDKNLAGKTYKLAAGITADVINNQIGNLFSSTVTLQQADIFALTSDSFTVVPAPGVGLVAFPFNIRWRLQPNGGHPYSVESDSPYLWWEDSVNPFGNLQILIFSGHTTDVAQFVSAIPTGTQIAAPSTYSNKPLVLAISPNGISLNAGPVVSLSISVPGSGYINGDSLMSDAGGTFTVTSVDGGGGVTGLSYASGDALGGANALAGGSGSGCTINATVTPGDGILTVTVWYTVSPE